MLVAMIDPRFSPHLFWKRVQQAEDGCWQWTGGTEKGGYGRYSWNLGGHRTRTMYAHRIAYELLVGPILEGLVIDHLCRNRRCVNPSHLEPVTMRTNTLRGETFAARNAAKTHCPKGHPFDTANTYVNPKGSRMCRACTNDASLQWKHRNRERVNQAARDYRLRQKAL